MTVTLVAVGRERAGCTPIWAILYAVQARTRHRAEFRYALAQDLTHNLSALGALLSRQVPSVPACKPVLFTTHARIILYELWRGAKFSITASSALRVAPPEYLQRHRSKHVGQSSHDDGKGRPTSARRSAAVGTATSPGFGRGERPVPFSASKVARHLASRGNTDLPPCSLRARHKKLPIQ